MVSIKSFISLLTSVVAFSLVFYSVARLMVFLSRPIFVSTEQLLLQTLLDDGTLRKGVVLSLSVDTILIIVFIFQHSLMKARIVKEFWSKIGMEATERSFYNIATSYALSLLISNWRRTPSFTLWNVDVSNSSILWWTFVLVHLFAWSIVYGGSLIMDLGELLGIKQSYFEANELNSPISYKSSELRRLYSHARHPSFTGISIILWFTNCMSLDRLILAVLWTIYMYVSWSTEPRDYAYQKNQYIRKKYELSNTYYSS